MKRALLGLVASLVLAAPAQALTPPELFVRQQRWDTHEETGPWIALASAPVLNYLGGYEVGYRLQASPEANNFQRVALTVTGVPDGLPTQPLASPPYCVGRAGTVGTIVPAGAELQFEGTGRYTVKVSLGDGASAPAGCLSGPSTTASFRVDVRVAPALVGTPLRWRDDPLPGDPFVGVRAPDPPGGQADVRCALDGMVQPDGSVTGRAVVGDPTGGYGSAVEWVFPRPGAWLCNARGTTEGLDDNHDTITFGTPWSAPIPVEVGSDFRYRLGKIVRARTRRPKFTFVAEWPASASGGKAKLALRRVTGCKGRRFKTRKAGTYRATFGAKRVQITVRRPRAGYYLGRFSFAGTHFLRPVADPDPLLLAQSRGRLMYVAPRDFQPC